MQNLSATFRGFRATWWAPPISPSVYSLIAPSFTARQGQYLAFIYNVSSGGLREHQSSCEPVRQRNYKYTKKEYKHCDAHAEDPHHDDRYPRARGRVTETGQRAAESLSVKLNNHPEPPTSF